ncbi:ATP-binding protein [Bacteroidota bacterium]
MKLFFKEILARKKIIIIFFIAIVLPLLVVVYFGFDTFTDRQESTKKLIESNLWVSSEAALNIFENKLLEQEKQFLNIENFLSIFNDAPSNDSLQSIKQFGNLFLLDNNFNIVYPRTGIGKISSLPDKRKTLNSRYENIFSKAELFEFAQRNYSKAIEYYEQCLQIAQSKQHEAFALEGKGRALLSLKNYIKAEEVYQSLSKEYSHLLNKAKHPYGIIASMQLYEIRKKLNKKAEDLKDLLEIYEKIRNGNWLLDIPTFNFFNLEIESMLNNGLDRNDYNEITTLYRSIKENNSPYSDALHFVEYLKQAILPKIKEDVLISRYQTLSETMRFLSYSDSMLSITSYRELPQFYGGNNYYGGFLWNIKPVKKELLPVLIENISNETGLKYLLVDEKNQNILSEQIEEFPLNAISLSLRKFPLPWKLIAIQPAFKDLEEDANKEILFYGLLFIIIILLMSLGAVLIVRDVTRDAESMKLKTEFVHNVSHELKTPLSLIRLYGETLLLKENLPEEDKKDGLKIITKESERLSYMINNILDFSRIEMGRKEFNFNKGNLAVLVKNTLESYRYHLERKGFVIKEEITSDLPLMNFDKDALEGVLINLLSNAIKFSPKEKEVTVKLFEDNKNAVIQVVDKGIGIQSGEISNIFERFYRSKQKSDFEARGSGLGLTLVKHSVEAHGGSIKVESVPGDGSVFSVFIPISRPNEDLVS